MPKMHCKTLFLRVTHTFGWVWITRKPKSCEHLHVFATVTSFGEMLFTVMGMPLYIGLYDPDPRTDHRLVLSCGSYSSGAGTNLTWVPTRRFRTVRFIHKDRDGERVRQREREIPYRSILKRMEQLHDVTYGFGSSLSSVVRGYSWYTNVPGCKKIIPDLGSLVAFMYKLSQDSDSKFADQVDDEIPDRKVLDRFLLRRCTVWEIWNH